jgi:hypothetical protein
MWDVLETKEDVNEIFLPVSPARGISDVDVFPTMLV